MDSDNLLLLEALADISYIAGDRKYFDDRSAPDSLLLISWTKDFVKKYEHIKWGVDLEYPETIYQFTRSKMDEENNKIF